MAGLSFVLRQISSAVRSLTNAASWLGVKKLGGTNPQESEDIADYKKVLYETNEAR